MRDVGGHWTSMGAHKPAFHIDDGAEELVGEIGAVISLLEVDPFG
jgi:hypothetical protein